MPDSSSASESSMSRWLHDHAQPPAAGVANLEALALRSQLSDGNGRQRPGRGGYGPGKVWGCLWMSGHDGLALPAPGIFQKVNVDRYFLALRQQVMTGHVYQRPVPDPDRVGAAFQARPRYRSGLWQGIRCRPVRRGRDPCLSLRHHLRRNRGGRAGTDRGVMGQSRSASVEDARQRRGRNPYPLAVPAAAPAAMDSIPPRLTPARPSGPG